MTIHLPQELEQFVAEQVQAGGYHDASAVVQEALQLLRDTLSAEVPESAELEEMLLEARRSPYSDLTAQDFAALRERIQRHIPAKA
jgi:putative addiction module CopG family antidote